ncbi:MAG: tRNA (adenosine(37)-N6)-threonylcarbamoyltransferase complex dimerization subunit type 1 TsaB, partial [Kiritimatiellae bacterium]|nr:tRNA (adenosine(37)-N6)-threonylcarbamoyltransferase complex dimerization subunit type 1 TsaB [Kiritimatiellia bacterium]
MDDAFCILAVEQSTPVGSIAILRGNTLLEQRTWVDDRLRNQVFFSELTDLCRSAKFRLEEVDLFAVGTGPGSFSGLRIAVAATSALALPGNKPVIGISSGEALAWSVVRETGKTQIAVVGDARRGYFWVGVFRITFSQLQTVQTYMLVEPNKIRDVIPPGSLIVTSDWTRIGEIILRNTDSGTDMLRENRHPTAEAVARLAMEFSRSGTRKEEPVRPIYLHQPVWAAHRDGRSG